MITVIENNEIELKTKDNNIINDYEIYLKEKNECVGYILYRKIDELEKGEISCIIFPKYREHGYASQALTFLSQYLNENNIDSFFITCDKNNIKALKLIKKYGQIISEREINNNKILYFECKTLEKTKRK